MKIITPAFLGLCLAIAVQAQAQNTTDAPASPAPSSVQQGPEALDTLLGPIALYPDALIALILPAATSPGDVVLAARYLQAQNDPAAVDAQPWSESVKALSHYPDVVQWMDQNLEWTQALGQAFVDQPADVMASVQRLRARAQASGALVSTAQQHVVEDDGNIEIVPAQPDTVYVPVYDPSVVYVQNTVWVDRPYLTFGFGYPIGSWFIYDCDWGRRNVWVVSRPADWRNRPQYWNQTGGRPRSLPGRPWQPPANYHLRPVVPFHTQPPAPRPLRPDTRHGAPAGTAPARNFTRPARPSSGIPATTPRAPGLSNPPDRPANVPRDRPQSLSPQARPAPAVITPGKPAPAPGGSTVAPTSPPRPPDYDPSAAAPRTNRPLNPDPVDRSHHRFTAPRTERPVVSPPAPPPATVPKSEAPLPDPRKSRPAP